MSRPRPSRNPALPPRLKHLVGVARQLHKHGDEPSLEAAMKTVIAHSEDGPFNPEERRLLLAAVTSKKALNHE